MTNTISSTTVLLGYYRCGAYCRKDDRDVDKERATTNCGDCITVGRSWLERILLLSPRLVMQFYNQSAAEASERSRRHGSLPSTQQTPRRRGRGGGGLHSNDISATRRLARFLFLGSLCFLVVFYRALTASN